MLDFHLTVFYTVDKRLSFIKAATGLLATQPAVTKSVQELKNQFSTALFDRRGNQVSLTSAGNPLLPHVSIRDLRQRPGLGKANVNAPYAGNSGMCKMFSGGMTPCRIRLLTTIVVF